MNVMSQFRNLTTKRQKILRENIPVRFLDRWSGRGTRIMAECRLFHGLPTPAMRAWIEAEERK